ncbi:DUF4931 domain-containing protein, partial [Patescibacteria group bacterium]|nr:DUF4931 domain-containing protein [Patescibacteria group bacterium]
MTPQFSKINSLQTRRVKIPVAPQVSISPKKPEIRKDYFLDRYVIITPARAARPHDVREEAVIHTGGGCVFCGEGLKKQKSKKDYFSGQEKIIAIANKYPAVTQDNPKAYGVHEVIIDTVEHGKETGDLPTKQIQNLIDVYAGRTCEISKDKKIEYILVFKNSGGKAGASIFHAHSQVFATKILPPDVMEELSEAHRYQVKHGICPYCKIIKDEEKSPRKIYADKNVVAITPYASQFHYEAWVFPRRHLDNITLLTEPERNSFAKSLKLILSKLNSINLSYNFFLHDVVQDKNQHFYLKIQPRESIFAGLELGSGMVINSIEPEVAA